MDNAGTSVRRSMSHDNENEDCEDPGHVLCGLPDGQTCSGRWPKGGDSSPVDGVVVIVVMAKPTEFNDL